MNMMQKFIVEIENEGRISCSSVETAIVKEIAPWNITVREER